MRILVYEWCCSGGLAGPDASADDEAASALHAEGLAMFQAVLRDACRDPGLEVTAVVDALRPVRLPHGARARTVPAGAEMDVLGAEAARVDAAILIAPETDGMLGRRLAAVRRAGGTVLAPDAPFVEVAADKQATAQALAAAGVPVPAGRALGPGADWPVGFVRPSVRKPRDGVGSLGLTVVRAGVPPPAAAAGATRAEAFAAGVPVGVSCLCGPRGIVPLHALRQRFAGGQGHRYLGGAPLADPDLARRAVALATRAIDAVARGAAGRALGWVGVDMILGARVDGRADRVLEVNPRVTTSFVGHAAGAATSLVRRLIDVAAGRDVRLDEVPSPFCVVSDGTQPPAGQ